MIPLKVFVFDDILHIANSAYSLTDSCFVPDRVFWHHWRHHKDTLKVAGIRCYKEKGRWVGRYLDPYSPRKQNDRELHANWTIEAYHFSLSDAEIPPVTIAPNDTRLGTHPENPNCHTLTLHAQLCSNNTFKIRARCDRCENAVMRGKYRKIVASVFLRWSLLGESRVVQTLARCMRQYPEYVPENYDTTHVDAVRQQVDLNESLAEKLKGGPQV